jgi:hypothetical protein
MKYKAVSLKFRIDTTITESQWQVLHECIRFYAEMRYENQNYNGVRQLERLYERLIPHDTLQGHKPSKPYTHFED